MKIAILIKNKAFILDAIRAGVDMIAKNLEVDFYILNFLPDLGNSDLKEKVNWFLDLGGKIWIVSETLEELTDFSKFNKISLKELSKRIGEYNIVLPYGLPHQKSLFSF
ncbi:MAG: hypothetical protein DRP29_07210 [Thermodesulfobacteriota bacterium]|nr:MAG: hypothetical protein DRP29_07210 [Thermodesulfobacteriota bacterium]